MNPSSHRMPRRPGVEPPTRYQFALLQALATKDARLRKYGYMVAKEEQPLAGRAQVRAPNSSMDRALLPGYTANRMLRAGYIEVIDNVSDGDNHYIDYMLTPHALRVVAAYGTSGGAARP